MVKMCRLGLLVLSCMGWSSDADAAGRKHLKRAKNIGNSGTASIYKGEKTANGEISRPSALTAAHRSLPFGTKVKVTNRRNKQTVVVRINDLGPFVYGRVIDLTPAAANQLRFSGLAPASLEVISR